MEYLIVGAGISGLYTAYSLHKRFGITNIMVIEKNKRLGGRIMTKYLEDGSFIEMGAGGIIDIQTNVNTLVKELGIEMKYQKGPNKKAYAKLSHEQVESDILPYIYHIDEKIKEVDSNFFPIMDELYSKLSNPKIASMAKYCNLYYFIERYYGADQAELMMYQHGYHDDFLKYNAYIALNMFQTAFSKDATFAQIPNGMSTIIKLLAEYLEKNGITIKLDTECLDINKKDGHYYCLTNDGEIQTDNIILSIPKKNMLQIKYLEKARDKLESVISKPLIRVYLFFPLDNGKVWFHDLLEGALTTKTLLAQIIPMNKEKGLMMIYCDGTNADLLGGFHKSGVLIPEVYAILVKIFGSTYIPKPTKHYVNYRKDATHQWKPCVDPGKMYDEIRQPILGENIFIVGETYSLHQEWSEGAVKSVNDLIKHLNINK